MSNVNELGTESIIEVAVGALEVGADLAAALKDGVQLSDAFVILQDLPKLSRIGANAKQAWAELKDLTGQEADDAVTQIAIRANLPDDGTALAKIGKALRLVSRTYRQVENTIALVEDWGELFDKKAAA